MTSIDYNMIYCHVDIKMKIITTVCVFNLGALSVGG